MGVETLISNAKKEKSASMELAFLCVVIHFSRSVTACFFCFSPYNR
jgi:hypothetical protein